MNLISINHIRGCAESRCARQVRAERLNWEECLAFRARRKLDLETRALAERRDTSEWRTLARAGHNSRSVSARRREISEWILYRRTGAVSVGLPVPLKRPTKSMPIRRTRAGKRPRDRARGLPSLLAVPPENRPRPWRYSHEPAQQAPMCKRRFACPCQNKTHPRAIPTIFAQRPSIRASSVIIRSSL